MIRASVLNQHCIKWFNQNNSFKNINKHVVQIDLPFLDFFRDEMAIYAIEQANKRIKPTDDGWTLDNLASGHAVFHHDKATRSYVDQKMKYYGVALDAGELSITVDQNQLPVAINRLLQAMLVMSSLDCSIQFQRR